MGITSCRPKWKGTMTDRDRFNNQIHYKSFDRCFNMEFGYWDEVYKAWPIFIENGITNNEDADIFFNFDRINIKGYMGEKWRRDMRDPVELFLCVVEMPDRPFLRTELFGSTKV